MLEKIREGSQGIVAKSILIVIILSFLTTGIGSYLYSDKDLKVAEVNNTEVKLSKFKQVYKDQMAQLKVTYGELFDQISEDPSYQSKIKNDIIESLIQRELLRQYIGSADIRVSDQEVATKLVTYKEFEVDNKFNTERYLTVLRQAGLTNDAFTQILREDLSLEKMIQGLNQSNFELNADYWALNRMIKQKREFEYVKIQPEDFKSRVELNDQDIQTAYEENSDRFTTPEEFKIEYISLKASDLKDSIQVSDEEVKTYYQENLQQFVQPEERLVADIHFKKSSKQDIQKIYAELQVTDDFASIAKKYSEDTLTAENGGRLAYFKQGEMPEVFDKEIFSLEKGSYSEIFEADNGMHIIKVLDVKEEVTTPLADVKSSIIEMIQDDKSQKEFYAQRQVLADSAYESPDSLDVAVKNSNQKTYKTDWVHLDALEDALDHKAVKDALSSEDVLIQRLNSDVIDVSSDHAIVLRVNDYSPAKVKPLAEVRDRVIEDLVADKSDTLALNATMETIQNIKDGKSIDTPYVKAHATRETQQSTLDASMIQKIFEMPQPIEKKVSVDYVKTQDAYIVLKLNAVIQDEKFSSDDRDKYLENIVGLLSKTELDAMISELKSQASIEVDQDLIAEL